MADLKKYFLTIPKINFIVFEGFLGFKKVLLFNFCVYIHFLNFYKSIRLFK